MSKKTPSNPENRTDRIAGIRQQIQQIGVSFDRLVKRYPFHFLTAMLVCMMGSAILAFTVMRVNAPRQLPAFPQPPASSAGSSITGIIDTYGALQEVTALQDTIASIIVKDTLNARDSVRLTEALQRFEQIQQSMYNQNNHP